jgi:3-hydroxybutyryl-CoA dehydratase
MQVTDPVCGRKIPLEAGEAQTEFKGWSYFFCSQDCLKRFRDAPEHFVENGNGAPPSLRTVG